MPALSQPHTFQLPIPGKLLFDRSDFVSLTGLSLRTVAQLIADGEIQVKYVGRRTLIPRAELLRFCEVAEPNKG